MFTDEQTELLKAPLDRAHVRQRSKAGQQLSYIEGWRAIAEANRIFGFGNWSRETVTLGPVCETYKNEKDNHVVSYKAKVRITVWGRSDEADVIREGSGFGSGFAKNLGDAHESALKEAETDAMKRALMTFGNPFGLALYDKDQKEVATKTGEEAGGPLGKTELKTKLREFCGDLPKCGDADELNALVTSHRDLLEQGDRDLPVWMLGKEGSDAPGIRTRITVATDRLNEMEPLTQ